MTGLLFARWRLLTGLTAATLVFGYVGVQQVEIATLRAVVARLDADERAARGLFEQCRADLQNVREARESDATISNDLGGFTVPPDWLLPFLAPDQPAP